MKRLFNRMMLVIAAAALCPMAGFAAVEDELKYLGYSSELTDMANDAYSKSHKEAPKAPETPLKAPSVMDEADAVKEQLAELGRSRSLTPETPVTSAESKTRLDAFWKKMSPEAASPVVAMPEDLRAQLREALTQTLNTAGYEINQLDLIDAPSNLGNPQVRAVIRVVKPLQTKDSYREIQNNLAQIKDACLQAGTIDGILYLSELTTFIAVNPKNKYYYEKTVLNP
ncbi:MAG TPA: hypothetical protein PLU72_17375 [Candidatus Ozemobacteraceae bacterium]|nr:hypothetical protein [Candidatus Ozemobacteraceae bacterium]HQG28783.1 hypothetical protein [Candidatus Ozemobacteraceae bacterium]